MTFIDSNKLSGHGIEAFFFPGGEPHVRVPEIPGPIHLMLRLGSWNDVGIAACLIDVLNNKRKYNLRSVFIPYFPGGRQDRSDGFTPRTLILMNDILRILTRTYVFDAHSEETITVTGAKNLDFTSIDYKAKNDVVGVISPDKGATTRAAKFAATYYPGCDFIQCEKTRDFKTGALTGYSMPIIDKVGRYIIIDDICDGGGTFNLIANEFKRAGIAPWSKLELVVSHGIFSKGLIGIDPRIDEITTTDSICRLNPVKDYLTIIPLMPEYQRIAS